ncbi:MAG: iron-sulfur cluster-binding domain-containing protein [bacterium]|nr:iron-sulfur cluster-binding domain-containing protein [bacterium]
MRGRPRKLAGVARRLVDPATLEFWLQHLDPLFAVERVRARVEAVQAETPRVRTFVLRPNRRWRGFRAGQHATVTVEVDGRRLTRTFSLAGGEDEPTLRLTIARQPDGRVTGALHDRVRPGAIVELGQAQGDFVLPDDPRAPLLLLAGGTGLTPFLSMLRTLAARGARRDVVLLCWAPRPAELIARNELGALPARLPGLRVHTAFTRDGMARFSGDGLRALAPDWAARRAYVCGPDALTAAVAAHWDAAGLTTQLRREWFGAPRAAAAGAGPVAVACTRSGRTVTVPGERSLLVELEAAGLRPAHGCRAGICRQCTCTLAAGAVEELRTGTTRHEIDEPIQLCAVRARTDLVLAV